jgi:hypothetical protein
MRSNDLQQPGAYSRNAIEPGQTAEAPLGLPIGQDDLGQPGTNLGQPRELLSTSPINIDPLAGLEWARLPHGAIALRPRRAGRQSCQHLNLTRRLIRTGEQMTDPLPADRKGKQEEQRALFRRRHTRR